ncbi:hypothetical protein LTR12_016053 [Friedmanniomyces endolithicus]|nr:hypothetical protein LTR12_016053 [Friedmanniomyces endolithicus]
MWAPLDSSGPIFPNALPQFDLHTNNTPRPDVTPATPRKRAIENVNKLGEGDSPSKRIRLDEPTVEQLGTRDSDNGSFVHVGGSGSSQSSRFEYRGGLAFSSVHPEVPWQRRHR